MSASPDLHTHSTASDGTLAPRALVRRAAAAGVRMLALTDHDTTAGLPEAGRAAGALGVRLVAGVEISVSWGGRTIHVLGLGIDGDDPVLQAGLEGLCACRRGRAEEIGRRLARVGIEGALAGAEKFSGGRPIGRTHFARFLVERGVARDVRGVFKRFLVKGKPGHVEGDWAALEQAVGWIRSAGGQAVIAHPARYRFTRTKLLRLIGEFKEVEGTGIEVVSGSHSRDDMFVFARHARENALYASAGSDYHGPENPWLDLGRLPALPEGCVPVWAAWTPPLATVRASA